MDPLALRLPLAMAKYSAGLKTFTLFGALWRLSYRVGESISRLRMALDYANVRVALTISLQPLIAFFTTTIAEGAYPILLFRRETLQRLGRYGQSPPSVAEFMPMTTPCSAGRRQGP